MPLTHATALITVVDRSLLVDGVTTLTVGGRVYTFRTSGGLDTDIVIGASNNLAAANIAIKVAEDTAFTLSTASALLTAVTLTANTGGAAGNDIPLSTTAVPGALTVTPFAGGADSNLVTKEDVKLYLDQITDTTHDDLLDTICVRVEDIVKWKMGFIFDDYTDETTKIVHGSGTSWLVLPPHEAGSITSLVSEGSTSEITGWVEDEDGHLFLTPSGAWGRAGYPSRYTVTANWGYGDWPEAVKEVAVEIAVNIFRERDKGAFSDVIGVEGNGAIAVGYAKALTGRQKMILDMIRRKYHPAVFV